MARWRDKAGQGLVETAVMLPLLVLLVCYAVDFGFFFLAMASIASSAHNAAFYATQGGNSPSGGSLPGIGSVSSAQSVAGMAYGNLSAFVAASTSMAVQLCTNNNGTVSCASTGQTGLIASGYQPDADPEPGLYQLVRVDVVYTVKPPVAMSFFGASIVPTLNFHRSAEMRVIQ